MRSFKCWLVCLILGFVLGCTSSLSFPNQRPASPHTQSVADRVAQTHVPVWIWGSVDDKGDINNPFCSNLNGIYIHARFGAELNLVREHDLLAFLIGHELRHVALKPSLDPVQDEREADVLGVVLAHRAGYDAHRAARLACNLFLVNVEDSHHPPARERCEIMALVLRYLESQGRK